MKTLKENWSPRYLKGDGLDLQSFSDGVWQAADGRQICSSGILARAEEQLALLLPGTSYQEINGWIKDAYSASRVLRQGKAIDFRVITLPRRSRRGGIVLLEIVTQKGSTLGFCSRSIVEIRVEELLGVEAKASPWEKLLRIFRRAAA